MTEKLFYKDSHMLRFTAAVLECVRNQRLLALAPRLPNPQAVYRTAALLVLMQDGFDPDDGIQDIRPRISLKRGEPLHFEHIILRRLIRQVAIFDRGHPDDLCRLFRFFLGNRTKRR